MNKSGTKLISFLLQTFFKKRRKEQKEKERRMQVGAKQRRKPLVLKLIINKITNSRIRIKKELSRVKYKIPK